jgi:hypothetical protein
MGRVAVIFGAGQGAKRNADIQSNLGQASNAGRRQKRCNPSGAKQNCVWLRRSFAAVR